MSEQIKHQNTSERPNKKEWLAKSAAVTLLGAGALAGFSAAHEINHVEHLKATDATSYEVDSHSHNRDMLIGETVLYTAAGGAMMVGGLAEQSKRNNRKNNTIIPPPANSIDL